MYKFKKWVTQVNCNYSDTTCRIWYNSPAFYSSQAKFGRQPIDKNELAMKPKVTCMWLKHIIKDAPWLLHRWQQRKHEVVFFHGNVYSIKNRGKNCRVLQEKCLEESGHGPTGARLLQKLLHLSCAWLLKSIGHLTTTSAAKLHPSWALLPLKCPLAKHSR